MLKSEDETYYDYKNQCWIVDGLIKDCNHPKAMPCGCFGREHAGKQSRPSINYIEV